MRLLCLGLMLCLLCACASRPTRPLSAADVARGEAILVERERQLDGRDQFRLLGRIAISDGTDSGSGSFDWSQRANAFTLSFTAPVTAQNWRLEAQPGQALLIESNGAVRVAEDAQTLLARELNWRLPADALRYWVLGMRSPGSTSEAEYTADGSLALLRQDGWEIRYPAFDQSQSPALPKKVFARSGNHQVRISVRRWTFPAE